MMQEKVRELIHGKTDKQYQDYGEIINLMEKSYTLQTKILITLG